ncbi:MAG: DNA internalization-related competence protein ComEC/Rec2 [Burkholderiaceae bacterium]|nr:DNA internalization-related competence protein ComEC/Rec2 [Burkholderiaceae bacterium]
MRSLLIGFAAGVCCLQWQANLPGRMGCLLLLAAWLAIILLLIRTPHYWKRVLLWLVGGVVSGFLWAALCAHHYLADELPSELEGRDIVLTGTVSSLPFHFPQGERFNFAVESAQVDGRAEPRVPPHVVLSWYAASRITHAAPEAVQPGERWQLTVRMKKPHGNANPFGFDYEAWLLEQHLRATGTVHGQAQAGMPADRDTDEIADADSQANRKLADFVWSFNNVVERMRAWMRDRILAALPDKQYAGVIVALVIGDERGVGQSDWKVFNNSGIDHLIAISGLHITLIAGLAARIAYALWARSFFTRAELPLLLPAHKVAALTAVLVGFTYVLLAGFSIPAQRTLYMLTVVGAAIWLGRIASVSHVACVALGVVLLLDPWAVLWPGFWLSFACVAIILFAVVGRVNAKADHDAGRLQHWWTWIKTESRTQLALTFGLVPVTMLLFGKISVISPVANAIAIPVMSFVVTPTALLGSVLPAPLSGWVLNADHGLIELLVRVLNWLTMLPAAVWMAPIPPSWIFLCALFGTAWLLAPRGLPLRWFGFAGWIPLLLNGATHPQAGQMWVTAFDVGQGMAVLVETPHHRLLYDTGPAYSPEANGGNRVIVPYLQARGIARLDGMVISHNDNDHSGGALSIFAEIPVDWVASSLAFDSNIVRAAPNHLRCVAGQQWDWDGVHFEVLQPAASSYLSTKYKTNAHSCTLRASLGSQALLLPGDIEAVQEAELVEGMPDKLPATVLLAPHHGSGTSSTLPFLQTVKPQVAVFQVGYRNRFHHPKPAVFARYGELGIARLRSDEAGAIGLRFGGELSFSEYRKDQPRYWYAR